MNIKHGIVTVSGVNEKVTPVDYSDKKFANFSAQSGITSYPACSMNDLMFVRLSIMFLQKVFLLADTTRNLQYYDVG